MELKQAALIGYRAELALIQQKIADLENQLRGPAPVGKPQKPAPNKTAANKTAFAGPLSAAGRRKIAAAQRKRWRTIKANVAALSAVQTATLTPPAAAKSAKTTNKRGRPRRQRGTRTANVTAVQPAQHAA